MNNIISFIAYICIMLIVLRFGIDALASFVNYKFLLKATDEKRKKILTGGFVYGSELPGTRIIQYTSDDFIKRYREYKIDVVMYRAGLYKNELHHTIITSRYICIEDEVICPESYLDYVEILSYLFKNLITVHNIDKEIKKSDPIYFENFYRFMYNLKKDNPFGEAVNDIVMFDALPKQYDELNKPFIYYDAETKNVFCYGFDFNPFILMIILSYYNITSTMNYEKSINYYEEKISSNIYDYIKNLPLSRTVTIIGIYGNVIKQVLSTIVTSIDDDKLINRLRNYKSTNYAMSYWESLPADIELEYRDMFGKDINS